MAVSFLDIQLIINSLIHSNELRGYGGELLRKATCKLIENLALSNTEVTEESILHGWLHVIETTISHADALVQVTYDLLLYTYLH